MVTIPEAEGAVAQVAEFYRGGCAKAAEQVAVLRKLCSFQSDLVLVPVCTHEKKWGNFRKRKESTQGGITVLSSS
jgi:hypothetical protein